MKEYPQIKSIKLIQRNLLLKEERKQNNAKVNKKSKILR